MKQVSHIEFALVNIKTKEFATFAENYIADSEVEISTSISFSVGDVENNILLVDLTTECGINEKNFLKIRVLFSYKIAEKSWEKLQNNQSLIFPKNLVTHLSLLSLGTLRGILFEKMQQFEGSISKYVLPLINISDLITEDVEIKLEK